MAQFQGILNGRANKTTYGTKNTGMQAIARGWEFGVRVEMRTDSKTGHDVAEVHLIGPSGTGFSSTFWLGSFSAEDIARLAAMDWHEQEQWRTLLALSDKGGD